MYPHSQRLLPSPSANNSFIHERASLRNRRLLFTLLFFLLLYQILWLEEICETLVVDMNTLMSIILQHSCHSYLLGILQVDNTIVHVVIRHDAHRVSLLLLAHSNDAAYGLLFCRLIPPRVDEDDAIRNGEIVCLATAFQGRDLVCRCKHK